MSVIVEVLKELVSMFVGDARLTLAILLLVAIVAVLVGIGVPPVVGGGVLLFGSLAILLFSVGRAAGARMVR